ncbi:unnamed protein product [Cylindrotheca closterium]|uniref:Mechanosensitive ion channel MscS domain-containing protein n=1 Tax=Cylindrotheca closterium TaxID=2856 RepID=A0AAD2JK93_9STRA|nr:unnamed protein product [Cylindrotheca closterium]
MEEVPKTIAVMEGAHANDDTLQSSNIHGGHRRGNSNLSDLFDPPQQNSTSTAGQHHHPLKRGISMESDAKQTLAEAARLRMEHNRTEESETQKITLDSLLQNSHYEHEATTHILTALEDQLGSTQAFENTILESVSDDASKALEESNSGTKRPSSHSTSRRSEDQQTERKQVMSPKRRHHRVMSIDDQLANLADQLIDHGFHVGPNSTPPVAPHSEFDRNAQLAFGAPDFVLQSPEKKGGGNGTGAVLRDRLFSGDNHPTFLPPVDEGSPSELMNPHHQDNQASFDGVVDLETPKTSQNLPPQEAAKNSPSNRNRNRSSLSDMTDKVKNDVASWGSFFRPQQATLKKYIKLMLYIALPLVGVAGLLFYFLDNPTTTTSEGQSVSWILIFVVRLWVTLTLALAVQALVIDLLCVQTRIIPRLVGPLFTLWIVQSQGWPFVIFMWSILNFGMLYGQSAFAEHWLFWQDTIPLFSEANPAGNVVSSDLYRVILTICATVPVAVSVKRLAVGLFLGRQSFLHFGERLAKVMDKMLLISQVAKLASRMEKQRMLLHRRNVALGTPGQPKKKGMAAYQDIFDQDDGSSTRTGTVLGLVESEKNKLAQMLDQWEEPERRSTAHKKASIAAVLRFRNALALIHNDYPFSFAFGLANKRYECVESAQIVFKHLLSEGETDVEFETIASSLAVRDGGYLNPERVKNLIRVFRPNRDGTLSVLDFVKSVDAVYKEFRLLQASIENSAQIDLAFDAIFNTIFYAIVVVVIMSQLGLDPMALFLSLSSVFLAFAFVIGSAASKYFEGILFILLRRPYNIGDLICATNIQVEPGLMGNIGWYVQNVTLFETTITWLPTMETASVANGALASSRIVNWARSPNARFVIFLYFPIETKYETLTLFRGAIEEYMKARPREWLAFNALRVLNVFTDKGYIQMELVVQHREFWQNAGAVYDSRGNLVSFCNEIQKLLGMQFKKPPLPVDIRNGAALEALDAMGQERGPTIGAPDNNGGGTEQAARAKFRQTAETKHKMFF